MLILLLRREAVLSGECPCTIDTATLLAHVFREAVLQLAQQVVAETE